MADLRRGAVTGEHDDIIAEREELGLDPVEKQVAIAAHKCWFASKDPAFRAYRMANELNSFSGQPRFLLVPANDYGGRPLLVVQARGGSSRVEVFGPLLGEPLGARIGADVNRWTTGDGACGKTA